MNADTQNFINTLIKRTREVYGTQLPAFEPLEVEGNDEFHSFNGRQIQLRRELALSADGEPNWVIRTFINGQLHSVHTDERGDEVAVMDDALIAAITAIIKA